MLQPAASPTPQSPALPGYKVRGGDDVFATIEHLVLHYATSQQKPLPCKLTLLEGDFERLANMAYVPGSGPVLPPRTAAAAANKRRSITSNSTASVDSDFDDVDDSEDDVGVGDNFFTIIPHHNTRCCCCCC